MKELSRIMVNYNNKDNNNLYIPQNLYSSIYWWCMVGYEKHIIHKVCEI